jgi:small subunit ribosomal protein S17
MEYGVVTSAATPKTIRVLVEYQAKHPKYGKFLRRSRRLLAHDEKGQAKVGDRVWLMECRPISKRKSWRLVEIAEAAP